MLTKITIRNFKLFKEVEIPLGNGFVFIGPNNGGKTSVLQALALWQIGLHKWAEKHASRDRGTIPVKRLGVTVNRLDLISLPVSEMDLIWFKKKVRRGSNENIRIDMIVEGVSKGNEWKCGLEFDYSNSETLFCRPLRTNDSENPDRMEVPHEALRIKLAFLPPMSGLATEEALIREGRINVLLGQGQTAEVLRNLCYQVKENSEEDWKSLVEHIRELFGVSLGEPRFLPDRGTIVLDYKDRDGNTTLDLQSSGRGMQQVLLLLSHLYDNAGNTVLLLDEPDAHLEVLRQRQVYQLINKVAEGRESQIISASHSEVLLNEAAQSGCAVAFVGKPHILAEGKGNELKQALKEIGFEYYYGAEQKGWILYLEGETDLRILQAFAKKLEHPAEMKLRLPLVKYVGNDIGQARKHFHSLREAKDNLQGFLLIDNTGRSLESRQGLEEVMWKKCEIENYLCSREAILSWATAGIVGDDLFGSHDIQERKDKMKKEIEKLEGASKTLNKPGPFSDDIKASDDFLIPLFKNFTQSLGAPESASLQKKDFYKLVEYLPLEEIDDQIKQVLNKIEEISQVENG